jgi:hypothetical protein
MLILRSLFPVLAGVTIAAVSPPPADVSVYGQVECAKSSTAPECLVKAKVSAKGVSSPSKECRNRDGDVVPCSLPGKGWYHASTGCYYRKAPAARVRDLWELPSGQSWFRGECGDPIRGFTSDFAPIRPFSTGVDAEALAEEATSQLDLPNPVIEMNPGPAVQVVHVPTWFWISEDSWRPISATASTETGPVTASVTATARPVRAVWSTGDGTTVSCQGRGTEWTDETLDPAAESPTCGHTYTRPSSPTEATSLGSQAPGHFQLKATITWQVTWAGAGTTGTADPMTTTSAMNVQVIEGTTRNSAGNRRGAGAR